MSMNRADRRKNGVVSKKVTITEPQFEHLLRAAIEAQKEILKKEVIERMSYLFCISLHDVAQLDKTKINDVVKRVQNDLICAKEGLVTIDDMKKWVKTELDLEFEFK